MYNVVAYYHRHRRVVPVCYAVPFARACDIAERFSCNGWSVAVEPDWDGAL